MKYGIIVISDLGFVNLSETRQVPRVQFNKSLNISGFGDKKPRKDKLRSIRGVHTPQNHPISA